MTDQTPEPKTVKFTGHGMSMEIDLVEVLTALDDHGRYRGYNPDLDEDVYEPSSFENQIVDATATLLIKSLRKDVEGAVTLAVADAIKAEVETIVRETLEGPVQQTTEWGSPTGEATPLRELIGKQAEKALKMPELRDGYSRSNQQTMVQKIIESEVTKAFKAELTAVVAEARAEALAAVKAAAADVITETITRATRGL